jgi:hypothetical protein
MDEAIRALKKAIECITDSQKRRHFQTMLETAGSSEDALADTISALTAYEASLTNIQEQRCIHDLANAALEELKPFRKKTPPDDDDGRSKITGY